MAVAQPAKLEPAAATLTESERLVDQLADRIGGPSVADALQSNAANAWSNPAVTEALADVQSLIKAGGFQTGYTSLQDNGTNDTLVTSGKAAMQLMGDWDISSILGSDPSFISSGDLGMAPFPTVAGGTGNAADLAGNTASYVSISTDATPAQTALAWILTRGDDIAPIPGTRRLDRLQENLAAADVQLSDADLREIGDAAAGIEVQGARYPDFMQRLIGR